MVEKRRDVARHIERHELMDDAARQALRGEPAEVTVPDVTAHRAVRAQALDQRKHADDFADAGAVHPDQRSGGRVDGGSPRRSPMRAADFLAALQAPRQQQRRERRRHAVDSSR